MFKEKNYQVIKGLISPEVSDIAYKYLLNKRRITKLMFEKRIISPYNDHWGVLSDGQIPDTWGNYGDVLMDTLLQHIKPTLEEQIDIRLTETYTYTRLYKHGDILKRHKDRPSCAVSATMNIGGDEWPIYVDSTGSGTIIYDENNIAVDYQVGTEPGVKVMLNPGDCLVYKGCELEHWRETFYGETCAQVFLHYNDASSPEAETNRYDGRPFVGIPKTTANYLLDYGIK